MRTFFLPSENWSKPYLLSGQEARHLLKVLRIKRGDSIRLLDGLGREGFFTVASTDKDSVLLEEQSVRLCPRPAARCVLAAGFGKALRRGWLLEKAVELEAAGVWLWQAEYSQGRLPAEIRDSWQAQMIAGAKQSVNPWLPELRSLPGGAGELAALRKDFDRAFLLWEDQNQDRLLSLADLRLEGSILFVLGPEGGFSKKEADLLINSGFTPVSLGARVLRWETAALLCLGLAWWANQNPGAPTSI